MFFKENINFKNFRHLRWCGVIPVQSFGSHIRPQPTGLGLIMYLPLMHSTYDTLYCKSELLYLPLSGTGKAGTCNFSDARHCNSATFNTSCTIHYASWKLSPPGYLGLNISYSYNFGTEIGSMGILLLWVVLGVVTLPTEDILQPPGHGLH